jgi:hypothetical protein
LTRLIFIGTFIQNFIEMKSTYLFLLLFSLFFQSKAQPPRRDTTRRDTVLGGIYWTPWHQRVTSAPILLTPTNAKMVEPNQKICFDKKMFVKANTGSRVLDMYIFINTEDGYVGILNGRENTLGNGDLKVDDEKFRFMLYTKKGNVFTYFNRKKKNIINHYVTTGNSEVHLTQMGFTSGTDVINKKTIRNIYCDNKFKTWSYKADGDNAPVLHVFGRTYPNKLICKDFIGYSGVGFLQTDAGTYISCEMEKGSFFTEMRTFEDLAVCFDASLFKHQEEEMYTKIQQGINNERGREVSMGGDCAAQKTILNNYKREMLNKKERDLAAAQNGNVYQNQNTQKAYAGLMDPIDGLQESIYDFDVKICKAQKRLESQSGSSAQKTQEKIACYNRQKSQLMIAKSQMQAADIRYANSPGQAFAEKTRIMSRAMQGGCN